MEYWKKLLSRWRSERRDGLTIPFIIGSQQFLPDSHVDQDIGELLIDIVNNNDTEVYITYCMIINDIILGIRDDSKKKIAGKFPNYQGGTQSKLFLSSFLVGLGDDVETISENLTDKFQEHIDLGRFSINDKQWGDYNPGEVNFIKACFSALEIE